MRVAKVLETGPEAFEKREEPFGPAWPAAVARTFQFVRERQRASPFAPHGPACSLALAHELESSRYCRSIRRYRRVAGGLLINRDEQGGHHHLRGQLMHGHAGVLAGAGIGGGGVAVAV